MPQRKQTLFLQRQLEIGSKRKQKYVRQHFSFKLEAKSQREKPTNATAIHLPGYLSFTRRTNSFLWRNKICPKTCCFLLRDKFNCLNTVCSNVQVFFRISFTQNFPKPVVCFKIVFASLLTDALYLIINLLTKTNFQIQFSWKYRFDF